MFSTLLGVTFGELLWDIILFPFWWYSFGAWHAFQRAVGSVGNEFTELNIGLWAKNLFTPMYGQYDWQGRLISFFMRLAQIIGRFIFLLVWMIFAFAVFLAYLLLPVGLVYYLIILSLL